MIFKCLMLFISVLPMFISLYFVIKTGKDLYRMRKRWKKYNKLSAQIKEEHELELAVTFLLIDLGLVKEFKIDNIPFRLGGLISIEIFKDLIKTQIDYKYIVKDGCALELLR